MDRQHVNDVAQFAASGSGHNSPGVFEVNRLAFGTGKVEIGAVSSNQGPNCLTAPLMGRQSYYR